MPYNLIIGIGNTGCQIVKAASMSQKLTECKFYAIDSVLAATNMGSTKQIEVIPIISDDKSGSGRSRERGAEMFNFHDSEGRFKQLYEDAANAKSPVIVITSSAGGTGSGATPVLCKKLIANNIAVIPIIICPAMKDPTAFHLNTSDLMLDLDQSGVTTYGVFRNDYGTADYTDINNEVVTSLEIILGKQYNTTVNDSIDDSDLDMLLSTPGRFIAIHAQSNSADALKRTLTQNLLSGHQPMWTKEDAESTFMKAFALSGPYATTEFENVFKDINERIPNSFDEYRHVFDIDAPWDAILIVSGLPRAELKEIDDEFHAATGIADGISTKSKRPSFMKNRGAIRQVPVSKPAPAQKIANDTDAVESENVLGEFFNK